MSAILNKIFLFCGLSFFSAVAAGISCGGEVAGRANEIPNPWEQVLARLINQKVLEASSFAFDSAHFGFDGGQVLGPITLGTLTEKQFHQGLDEVRTVIPGLIYTQLIFRWASWIGEDYGDTKGQLFALMMLNPDQKINATLDDAATQIGADLFRTGPSLYDLAYVRSRTLPFSPEIWEKTCWRHVSPALVQIRSGLQVEKPAFDLLDSRLRTLGSLRSVQSLRDQNWRQRRYSVEYEVSGIQVSGIGEESPFQSVLTGEIDLRESSARDKQPYVVLDTRGYGARADYFREQMVAYAQYDYTELGVAVAIKTHTASRMLADIEAVRIAVNEAFGGK